MAVIHGHSGTLTIGYQSPISLSVSDRKTVLPVGRHCTKCGETAMWPGTQALADKQEQEGNKIQRVIVQVICDKCLQKQQDN
jgi:hypothetical protein